MTLWQLDKTNTCKIDEFYSHLNLMAQVRFGNKLVNTIGELPAVGSKAPDFRLVTTGLKEVTLSDYEGERIVLNIFPSIDTHVCGTSVKRFNEESAKLNNTVILCISRDLPFAQSRFCGKEGIENVITLSGFRDDDFGKNYGVTFTDGLFKGLFSRAVVVIDAEGKVIHTEQVPHIGQEPDYETVIKILS